MAASQQKRWAKIRRVRKKAAKAALVVTAAKTFIVFASIDGKRSTTDAGTS
jgi:hypothetical protein